ncbi:MAG: rod shape-determining protein MreC [Zoogloeaceae bacterium]|nr:rod shape-determining protein MreC [Zoogloeaceae bacterium]
MSALEQTPPPFFRRGPAPLAVLIFYAALSVALFVLDMRFHALGLLRQGISIVTDPLQRMAQSPLRLASDGMDYFRTINALREDNRAHQAARLRAAPDLARLAQLEAENAHLRRLLALRERDRVSGQAASILYAARDPFSRRVYLDKGMQHGLRQGQPVIDDAGIIGQVTQVFPFSAEVTLLTDKDQAVPVQILRTGQRSVTFGLGNGQMELRHMPVNADVEVGDELVTSGLDGIYPSGFPVATVTQVERDSAYAFARILVVPRAAVESHGMVMALDYRPDMEPRPPEAKENAGQNAPVPRRRTRAGRAANP